MYKAKICRHISGVGTCNAGVNITVEDSAQINFAQQRCNKYLLQWAQTVEKDFLRCSRVGPDGFAYLGIQMQIEGASVS